jgi:hypothetical protein
VVVVGAVVFLRKGRYLPAPSLYIYIYEHDVEPLLREKYVEYNKVVEGC